MLGSFGMWTVCLRRKVLPQRELVRNTVRCLAAVHDPKERKNNLRWDESWCCNWPLQVCSTLDFEACIVILIKSSLGTAYVEFYRIFIMYERLCCHPFYTSLSCGVLCSSLSTLENFARHSWPSPCWRWRMPKGEWIQQMTPCARRWLPSGWAGALTC